MKKEEMFPKGERDNAVLVEQKQVGQSKVCSPTPNVRVLPCLTV